MALMTDMRQRNQLGRSIQGYFVQMLNRFSQVEGELELRRHSQIRKKQGNEKANAKLSDLPGFHKIY